jgi:hypothetical protein
MERRIIFDHVVVSYSGLFSMQELYRMIDFWFMEKGYTKHETIVKEDDGGEHGKTFFMCTEPYRKISDYVKYVVRCEIECKDVKVVEVERDNTKIRMNHGECNVIVTGYIVTDYKERWTQNGTMYFIRALFDKYIWRDYIAKGESGLVDECTHLLSQVKGFLNLYRYQT